MRIHRNHEQQHQHVARSPGSEPAARGAGDADAAGRSEPTPPMQRSKRRHPSFFGGLDAAARTFLGPPDRSDGTTPVVHAHDAAEDSSDETLRSVEIYTDSFGHHYGQRKPQAEQREP